MKKGQIQISLLTGIVILMGSIATPILWITNINQATAVEQVRQDGDIKQLQNNYNELKTSNELISKKVDKLLWKQGIDPTSIK